jgi:[CysO sulfur-carrier protein]-thiocarboxylate-dependent cysteine synthase
MTISGIVEQGPASGSKSNFESLAQRVGNTPVWNIAEFPSRQARLLVKLEGNNPTGSVKDRACVAILKAMIRDASWNPSRTLLDASSGNMGCSIAYFGRSLGVAVRIIASTKLTAEKRLFMEYFGASVEVIGEFTADGSAYCADIMRATPDACYFLDQLHNPVNPHAHAVTTGPEILSQVPGVSAVIGSIGSGGTLLGVGRYLKSANAQIRICAVEAAPGTRLPGTAALADGDYRTPFIEEGFASGVFDLSIQVSEAEAVDTALRLSSTGLFGGLQTWAVIAAARHAIEVGNLAGDVVVISGDTGWKNMSVLADKVMGPSVTGGGAR